MKNATATQRASKVASDPNQSLFHGADGADMKKRNVRIEQAARECQSAHKIDPISASKVDPFVARIVTEGGRSPTGVTMRAAA
jgi:hypothetical protein